MKILKVIEIYNHQYKLCLFLYPDVWACRMPTTNLQEGKFATTKTPVCRGWRCVIPDDRNLADEQPTTWCINGHVTGYISYWLLHGLDGGTDREARSDQITSHVKL